MLAAFSCIVCPRCVGVHRGVGADRVIPKSAVLDDEYWTAEHVNAAKEGRAHADTAGLLEPCCDAATARPERERLIREKYGFDPVDTAGRADANKNTFTHVVTVTVVECKDLINGDTMCTCLCLRPWVRVLSTAREVDNCVPSTALSDPYVIVQLGASGAETPQVWRTSVKSNTLNPVYNEVRAPAPALPTLDAACSPLIPRACVCGRNLKPSSGMACSPWRSA